MEPIARASATALELCCGIGGATIGLHDAGYASVGVDVNRKAIAVARANGHDAHELDLYDPAAADRLRALQPSPDLIWASPSCKGFSLCSGASAEHKQLQNSLTTRCAALIAELAPPTFIIENVLQARANETFQAAILTLNRHYHTVVVPLDACRLGVPQSRRRLFVIGVRTNGDDLAAVHHMTAFVSRCKERMREGPACTIEQAIPELTGKRVFFFPRRKENQCVFESNRPAPTVRSMVLAHPSPSLLAADPTIAEALVPTKELTLRLCGFPPSFQMGAEKVASAVQLGNVVAPPVARYVADFTRALATMAGDGAARGVALAARYAIPPVRFAAA